MCANRYRIRPKKPLHISQRAFLCGAASQVILRGTVAPLTERDEPAPSRNDPAHERVADDVGWTIIPDLDVDRPFQEPVFVLINDLLRGYYIAGCFLFAALVLGGALLKIGASPLLSLTYLPARC